MPDPDELVEVLSRRHDVLRSLRDEPMERHVLVDHLEDSKSTVYKGVSQLREQGLVEQTPEGLQPTLFGLVALERYDELARTADLGELLAALPRGAVDPRALVSAEAVTPDGRAVDRHLARVESILRDAEDLRGFSPAVAPEHVSILHERVVDEGLAVEFVLPADLVTHLRRDHPAALEAVLAVEHAALYRTERDLPFTLLLASSAGDIEVCLELGEGGLATGLVVNDTAESRRWAEAEYERQKRAAEPVPP